MKLDRGTLRITMVRVIPDDRPGICLCIHWREHRWLGVASRLGGSWDHWHSPKAASEREYIRKHYS